MTPQIEGLGQELEHFDQTFVKPNSFFIGKMRLKLDEHWSSGLCNEFLTISTTPWLFLKHVFFPPIYTPVDVKLFWLRKSPNWWVQSGAQNTWWQHLGFECRPTITRWWFQIFFIFTPTRGRFPIWLGFFRWVETTNQIRDAVCESFLHHSWRGSAWPLLDLW